MLFATVALAAGLAYSVLLPFDFTLRIFLVNWRFFTPALCLVRHRAGAGPGLAGHVADLRHAADRPADGRPMARGWGDRRGRSRIRLLPSFLCCSPIVPTVVGLLGLPVATQVSTTGNIAYFSAANQDWLLAGALVCGSAILPLARPPALGPPPPAGILILPDGGTRVLDRDLTVTAPASSGDLGFPAAGRASAGGGPHQDGRLAAGGVQPGTRLVALPARRQPTAG